MTTDDFCFYLQNRLIQTSQTGGQWYSDTSPFSIPWSNLRSIYYFFNIQLFSFSTIFFTSFLIGIWILTLGLRTTSKVLYHWAATTGLNYLNSFFFSEVLKEIDAFTDYSFLGWGYNNVYVLRNVPLIFRLVCYQQMGRVGQAETEWKFVGVSGKCIRYFTLPPAFCTIQ